MWFPAATWGELKYHERQWLRVEAAAMVSNAAVLVGRSAARKLGMWVISRGEEPVEVTLPSRSVAQSRAQSGRCAFRFSKLRRDEQLIYEGHCITTPIRTFIDIARYHGSKGSSPRTTSCGAALNGTRLKKRSGKRGGRRGSVRPGSAWSMRSRTPIRRTSPWPGGC